MADVSSEPSSESTGEPAPRRREPIINAPIIVWGTALLLVALYALFFFSPIEDQIRLQYDFALVPRRFWAPAGDPDVYPSMAAGLLTLLSTALLHGDWMHVLVNSAMLLAFGTPVARAFGPTITGAGKWMLLFLVSVLAGSIFYLWLRDADAGAAVGASGGVSGLVGAAFQLDAYGNKLKIWSRPFLMMTVAFGAANAVLTFIAPYAFGMNLAWEAHIGGFIAGALLMALMPVRGYRAAEA